MDVGLNLHEGLGVRSLWLWVLPFFFFFRFVALSTAWFSVSLSLSLSISFPPPLSLSFAGPLLVLFYLPFSVSSHWPCIQYLGKQGVCPPICLLPLVFISLRREMPRFRFSLSPSSSFVGWSLILLFGGRGVPRGWVWGWGTGVGFPFSPLHLSLFPSFLLFSSSSSPPFHPSFSCSFLASPFFYLSSPTYWYFFSIFFFLLASLCSTLSLSIFLHLSFFLRLLSGSPSLFPSSPSFSHSFILLFILSPSFPYSFNLLIPLPFSLSSSNPSFPWHFAPLLLRISLF